MTTDFKISSTLDLDKVFLLQKSALEKRLDPSYYLELRNHKFEFSHPSKTISRIVKTYNGGTPNKSNPSYWNGDICWASPKDMRDFYLIETEDKITSEGVENSSTIIAPVGSVIIVFRSGILQHTLPVSVAKVETAINQDLKILVPSSEILPEYLATFLKTFEKRILPRIVKHSTTVQSINQEEFNQLSIPIPEIDIQNKVIDINKTVIENQKQNQAKADKLLASIDDYLLSELGITLPVPPENTLKNRIFTTSIKQVSGNRLDPFYYQEKFINNLDLIKNCRFPVRELIDIINKGLIKGTLPKHDEKEGKNSVIQISCINSDGSITLNDILTAKDIYHNDQKLNKGDILVVITGATIGKIAYWSYEGDYYLGGDIVKFQTKSSVLNSYVYNFLRSKLVQIEIKRNITGATNGHLSPDDIKHMPIPLPPIEKQQEIADHITAIRRQAQQLKDQTKTALENARKEIEKIIIS